MPKTTLPHAGVLIVCEIARHRSDPGLPYSSDTTLDLRADFCGDQKRPGSEVSGHYGAAPEPNLASSAMGKRMLRHRLREHRRHRLPECLERGFR
jgi:hypothetical protein